SSKAMPTMKFSVMVFYMCDDNNIPVRTTGMGYERYKDELRVTCDRFEVAPGDVRGAAGNSQINEKGLYTGNPEDPDASVPFTIMACVTKGPLTAIQYLRFLERDGRLGAWQKVPEKLNAYLTHHKMVEWRCVQEPLIGPKKPDGDGKGDGTVI